MFAEESYSHIATAILEIINHKAKAQIALNANEISFTIILSPLLSSITFNPSNNPSQTHPPFRVFF